MEAQRACEERRELKARVACEEAQGACWAGSRASGGTREEAVAEVAAVQEQGAVVEAAAWMRVALLLLHPGSRVAAGLQQRQRPAREAEVEVVQVAGVDLH